MYKKIMVPLDGSELAESVLSHVEAFIKGFNINDVILVRVQEPDAPSEQIRTDPDVLEKARETEKRKKADAEKYLNKIAEHLKREGTSIHSEVLGGKVADSLIDYTDSNDIDLIIISSRGLTGITRWVMGSVADKVFRSAKVPVLMVRGAVGKGEAHY